MVFCSECGKKHEDDAAFCENCGRKLEKPVIHRQGPEKKEKESKSLNTSKLKYLKFVALFLVVVVVFSLGRNLLLGYNDPGVKLMHGGVKALKESKPEFELVLSVEDADQEYQFMKDVKVEIAGSMRKEDLAAVASIKYGKKDLAESVIAYQEGHVFIDLMDLYEEVMYADASDVENDITELVAMKEYLQDLDIKGVNWKIYGKIFTNEMGRNIDKDGSDVLLTMDIKDLSSAFEKMLDEAENDKDLKEGLQKSLEKMLKAMIKDDFEIGGADKSDFEEGLEEMTDNWDEAFESLIYQARNILVYDETYWYNDNIASLEGSMIDDQELRFSFTFGKLTGIQTVIDMGGMEVKAILSLNDGYKAKSYKTKKADAVEDYGNDDVTDMMIEVAENLLDNIEVNKGLVKDIEESSLFNALRIMFGIDDLDDLLDYIEDNGIENLIYIFTY